MDENDLKRLFYRKNTTFTFEKYVTKMKQTFNVPIYEEDKVSQLLNNINFPNKTLKTEVNICISSHSASFKIAFTYLSTVISHILPETQPSSVRHGRRQ